MTKTGTDFVDTLIGGAGADTLLGLGLHDILEGRGGNDWLDGGSGEDILAGGIGGDTLLGGAGNDYFSNAGLDSSGDDSLAGGNGADIFYDLYGDNTLRGGAGDDLFFVFTLDGGSNRASGGSGRDTWLLTPQRIEDGRRHAVIDFETGPGGDLIDARQLLDQSASFGFLAGGNPFDPALGFLRLVPSGDGDTKLQWDFDGAAGETHGWITTLTLRNRAASALDPGNFTGGLPPDGSEIAGRIEPGTRGDDRLDGWLGDDSLSGGAGNDRFNDPTYPGQGGLFPLYTHSVGNDTLRGGAGEDSFYDRLGSNRLVGGAGADFFSLFSYDGGANRLSGGEGRDTYQFEFPAAGVANLDYTVTDFATGTGGDLIDLVPVLEGSANAGFYAAGNPFDPLLGFFRLRESAGDTLLEADRDGAAGGAGSFVPLLRLRGVAPGSLTAENFTDGIAPDGSLSPGRLIEGTGGQDTLEGEFPGDTLRGFGGHDYLDGRGGDDLIEGGDGPDFLIGGLGNDTVKGGRGDDGMSGIGIDYVGDDHLLGGPGSDFLFDVQGTNVLHGGAGDDRFVVWDAGISVAQNRLIGGTGRDTYEVKETGDSSYTVTDFLAGAGGDLLDLDDVLAYSTEHGGANGYTGGDPFTQGHVRLRQSGAHTLLQVDLDAAGTVYGWSTALTLKNVAPGDVTADNFVGQLVVGTEGADTLEGGLGHDTLLGLGGEDVLDGLLGADSMEGGTGNDLYYVDDAGDRVIETSNGPAALAHGALAAGLEGFIDTVIAAVNYSLGGVANVENVSLAGKARRAMGNGLDNVIKGNALDNLLDGKGGNDTLTGGGGRDAFGFSTAPSAAANRDTIKDFVSGVDKIRLEDAVFAALGPGVNAGELRAGANATTAADGNDYLIYNISNGALYYDADGSGTASSAVRFATLVGAPAVSHLDFVMA